mgnify:CR=1 FL=1|tara:strand:+ start:8253 stop:8597 length:345 start_codon:yes stop_codon:yes gene_type:complete
MALNIFNNAQLAGTTTVETLYTAPSIAGGDAADYDCIVLECDVANIAAATAVVDVAIVTAGAVTAYLVKGAQILVGSSMKVVSGQKIVLKAGDAIHVTSTQTVDANLSVLEDIN